MNGKVLVSNKCAGIPYQSLINLYLRLRSFSSKTRSRLEIGALVIRVAELVVQEGAAR
jgi:hypothetical protein